MIEIRDIKEIEIKDVIDIALLNHKESPLHSVFTVNLEKSFKTIYNCVNGKNNLAKGIFLDDILIGVVLGYIGELWYSNELVGSDLMMYVKKEHRNRNYGLKLIRLYREWADKNNIIPFITNNSVIDPRISSLYKRAGFMMLGSYFVGV